MVSGDTLGNDVLDRLIQAGFNRTSLDLMLTYQSLLLQEDDEQAACAAEGIPAYYAQGAAQASSELERLILVAEQQTGIDQASIRQAVRQVARERHESRIPVQA